MSPEARLGPGVDIGPYAVVESDVDIGEGSRIAAHAVVKRGSRLGADVRVGEGAVLGGEPQDSKFSGVRSFLEVGDGTVIREFATLHRSAEPGGTTRVGRGCLIMIYSHVAHDSRLEDGVILGGHTALAGHIHVGSHAFISGGVVIHQFSHVGELSMIGGGSKVNRDVPPFFTVDGVPARAVGVNVVGLGRAGFESRDVRTLKEAFRILYRSSLPLESALERISALGTPADRLVDFVRKSERGICASRRRSKRDEL